MPHVDMSPTRLRKALARRIVVLCAIFLSAMAQAFAQAPNLLPATPAKAPNYWCTWYAQNYWIGRGGEVTDLSIVSNPNARDTLNYQAVFNPKDGWATKYLPRGRADYYFLIDHGWQTKVAAERTAGGGPFYSLQIDPRDFEEYADTDPQEALRLFNEEIKSLGWRGLGIWVRGAVTPERARTFVAWSKYAGVEYWKIDGGDIDRFNAFHAKQEIFPELVLEYVTGAEGNLNPKWDQPGLKEYPSVYEVKGSKQESMLKVLQFTDAFRTYDATPILMTSTTLRRTHDILKQTAGNPQYRAVLNVQDDCNAAIGLGVLVASKRHPNYMERTYKGRDLHHQLSGKRHMQKRINEVERFGRWARIAPAFPAGQGSYAASSVELVDSYPFTEWDTWNSATYGVTVHQSAPAIIARNMPLPKVEVEGDAPFVMATTYPNGPVGIATEGRVKPSDQWYHPRATVTVQIKDATQPIGIAGHYRALVLEFGTSLDGVKHVWAQDLLADAAIDVKDRVRIEGSTLTIPGSLIDEIGTAAGDKGDSSAPGMVLRLER
jgi:hypothetical protein